MSDDPKPVPVPLPMTTFTPHATPTLRSLPKLEVLDMHGVDDDGVYHPPSRLRYHEMLAREEALEARVTELQAACTRVENERRLYKSLHEAERKMLIAACVEIPVNIATMVRGEPFPISKLIQEVHERNERLEADAWCGATNDLRAYVQAYKTYVVAGVLLSNQSARLREFADRWAARFAETLKR